MPFINYVEFNSGDIEASMSFYKDVFDWDPKPWSAEDYFVAGHGEEPGIDTGFTTSEDGQPITVDDLRATWARSSSLAARSSYPCSPSLA